MNYEKDIEINESELDVEVLNQPKLALKYSIYYAKCLNEVTKLSEKLKLLKAEFTDEVLRDPSLIGVDKTPTAPMIEAYYRGREEYKQTKEEWVEAKDKLAIAEVVKQEICYTRKTMLSELVKLHGQQYFAGPSVPRDLTAEAVKKRLQNKSDKGVAKRLKRNK